MAGVIVQLPEEFAIEEGDLTFTEWIRELVQDIARAVFIALGIVWPALCILGIAFVMRLVTR